MEGRREPLSAFAQDMDVDFHYQKILEVWCASSLSHAQKMRVLIRSKP
jgi:hypothetical protein